MAQEIFIEAESFRELGGWVIDQQSMESLHSAYIMAHGMGRSVANAKTSFTVTVGGTYYIWALTRDWTAEWNIKESAGRFDIAVDGQRLEHTLGTNGKAWSWQLAGNIVLCGGEHTIELCDLTGFNGRCDAVYITDSKAVPDSGIEATDSLRKRLNYIDVERCEKLYDLVVVGGGIAGICTALSASRSGVKTLLINDRFLLGGCNSSEIRVCMGGQIKLGEYPELGNVVREIAPVAGNPCVYKAEYYEDARKLLAFENTDAELMLGECVTDVEMRDKQITAVICTNIKTGKKTEIYGKMFVDCSGDAVLARHGGAELMYGKEGKKEYGEGLAPDEHKSTVMGHSIRWYSQKQEQKTDFPNIDWKLSFNEENFLNCTSGDWEQETGFGRDMVKDIEYIRDYGLRAIYANWSYQKNHSPKRERFANDEIVWVSPLGGKRESVRVKGDFVITQKELEEQTVSYPDGTAEITWGIDIHLPETQNENEFGEAFRSFAYHRGIPKSCPVPYRCLYSKDIENLFLGGRIISASHVAFSALRVMRTLGMLGEVVGMAASICKKHSCRPRDIYTHFLDELKALMKQGVHIPDAFACGSIGTEEKYHFKDMEWWDMEHGRNSKAVSAEEVEKFKLCVNKWGIEHIYPMPDKWK